MANFKMIVKKSKWLTILDHGIYRVCACNHVIPAAQFKNNRDKGHQFGTHDYSDEAIWK